jgi:hypothetical protein
MSDVGCGIGMRDAGGLLGPRFRLIHRRWAATHQMTQDLRASAVSRSNDVRFICLPLRPLTHSSVFIK